MSICSALKNAKWVAQTHEMFNRSKKRKGKISFVHENEFDPPSSWQLESVFLARERESLKTWARGKGCVGVVLERVYAKVLDTWTIDDKKRSWHGLAKRFVLFFLSFFFFFFPPPLPPRELFPLETIEQCFGPLRAGETVEEEAVACGRGSRRRETGGGEVPVYNLLGRATIMFSRATVPTSQCEPKKHHYRVQFIKYLLECRD